MDFKSLVHGHRDLITQIRRDLHRIPEPGYSEQKTAAYVGNFLKQEEFAVREGITKTGVETYCRIAWELLSPYHRDIPFLDEV